MVGLYMLYIKGVQVMNSFFWWAIRDSNPKPDD